MRSMEDRLSAIGARYKATALYIFGSRAAEIASRVRGKKETAEFPDSDVDIGIQPEPGTHLAAHTQVRLVIEPEDVLGVKRVDLVVLPEAGAFLALDVIRGELLYWADADAQAEGELRVLRRTGDLAQYARDREHLILSGGNT